MSGSKVIQLDLHDSMTPDQALAVCVREDWDDIIICGYHSGSKSVTVRCSRMSRETALWIAEQIRAHALAAE